MKHRTKLKLVILKPLVLVIVVCLICPCASDEKKHEDKRKETNDNDSAEKSAQINEKLGSFKPSIADETGEKKGQGRNDEWKGTTGVPERKIPSKVSELKVRFEGPQMIHIMDEISPQSAEIFSATRATESPASFRKEMEYPKDDKAPDPEAQEMYEVALGLLGKSACRDVTAVHIITSVGKTKKTQEAYKFLEQAAALGHLKAMELVAWAQLLGPLPLNITGAAEKLEYLADKGYPNGQMGLGFLHASGIVKALDPAPLILYYTIGALHGSGWSQMALGYRYWTGVGVVGNCLKALEQYRRVAATVASEVSATGTGPALSRVRLLEELEGGLASGSGGSSGNPLKSDIVDYYTMLAERGDVQAQVGLGQLHFQGGRGVSPDHHLALKYFSSAADVGSAVAMAYLGKMYLDGSDAVEADNATALKWFTKAAELNNAVGQSGLGLMYLSGRGLPKDTSKAFKYFSLAAEQGWVDGHLNLGNMYLSGIGVQRDFSKAFKHYNLAAQFGHILAIYNLAQMHATGIGTIRSCPTAVELYKTVAERGRWGLLLSLAHQDYQEQRYSQALLKYLVLADLGYEVAQSNAAFMLERGEIGPELMKHIDIEKENPKMASDLDPEDDQLLEKDGHLSEVVMARALQLWSRAATQGYSQARVRLGDYYYYGWGTLVDYSNAATQYRLASEHQRNPQAMFNLAYMHEQGLGLKQDLHLAKRFYDMAAETSPEATVPATLALLKLRIVSSFKTMSLFGLSSDPSEESTTIPDANNKEGHGLGTSDAEAYDSDEEASLLENFAVHMIQSIPDWDLYLISILFGVLGILLYFGRQNQNP